MHPLLRSRLSVAWPCQCAVCRSWGTQRLCELCVERFAPGVPRCRHCALPLPEGQTVCGECLVCDPATRLDACVAAAPYAFPWDGLLLDFKFHGAVGLSYPLATLLRHTPWAEPLLERCAAVLPVPLSSQRLRSRGYNPSLELARRLSPDKLRHDWLVRVRDTPPQHGLPRSQRLSNVHGCFAVSPQHLDAVRAAPVLLLDDVMTTGATLREGVRVLRQAGAAWVGALVLARAESLPT